MDSKLTYEEFTNYCLDGISRILRPSDYTVELTKTTKADDYIIDAISVTRNESTISYSIRIEEFYKDYLRGKSLGDIIIEMLKLVDNGSPYLQESDLKGLFDSFDNSKNNLIIRAISYPNNRKLLQDHCFRLIADDIALVLYMFIKGGESGLVTAKVPKGVVKGWSITENEVINLAIANTVRIAPPVLLPIEAQFFNPRFAIEDAQFMSVLVPYRYNLSPRGNTLTTVQKTNGATAAFYPGVPERLYQLCQEEYYVAFTSIHEAVIHRVSDVTVKGIARTINDMARESRLYEDKTALLSKKVYRYNSTKKAFVIVG